MANTSFKYPVINTTKDNSGNITDIKYQLFLPQNKLQIFSSSYIKQNQDINLFKTDIPKQTSGTIYTKYDMGVEASSYLKYKLKYYQHSLQNKSSYTNFILGNDEPFIITIIDGGKNYTNKSYKIKISNSDISNNENCWLCDSSGNSNCNNECNKILQIQ